MRKTFFLALLAILFSCSPDDTSTGGSAEIKDPEEQVNLPELQTAPVTDLSLFSVNSGGNLIDDGGSEIVEMGLVVSSSSLPSIEDNLNKFSVPMDGSTQFDIKITTFLAGTKYYIRAYAVNSAGVGYGNEVSFTSPEERVFGESIILDSQDAVDQFGANGYTTIIGDLLIEGSVSDLTPLQSIVIVNQAFAVRNTTALKNLEGLNSLKVTGNAFADGFRIENNSALESLSGLNDLEVINGQTYIIDNTNLINLEGLNSLFAVSAGDLAIFNCANLESLSGLEKLEFIGDSFFLTNNPKLSDLSALVSLNYVDRRIGITENPSLQNISGFNSLSSVERVIIRDNDNLVGLDGLRNLTSIGFVDIEGNDRLNDLSGLGNVTSPIWVGLKNNSSLENTSDLENLDIFALAVVGNTNLNSLAGLEHISSLMELYIQSNPSLSNLEGLNGLTTISGSTISISIHSNSSLNSLKGLENLTAVEGSIKIFENPVLTDFCPLYPLFATNGHTGSLTIADNLSNPNAGEVVTSCQ